MPRKNADADERRKVTDQRLRKKLKARNEGPQVRRAQPDFTLLAHKLLRPCRILSQPIAEAWRTLPAVLEDLCRHITPHVLRHLLQRVQAARQVLQECHQGVQLLLGSGSTPWHVSAGGMVERVNASLLARRGPQPNVQYVQWGYHTAHGSDAGPLWHDIFAEAVAGTRVGSMCALRASASAGASAGAAPAAAAAAAADRVVFAHSCMHDDKLLQAWERALLSSGRKPVKITDSSTPSDNIFALAPVYADLAQGILQQPVELRAAVEADYRHLTLLPPEACAIAVAGPARYSTAVAVQKQLHKIGGGGAGKLAHCVSSSTLAACTHELALCSLLSRPEEEVDVDVDAEVEAATHVVIPLQPLWVRSPPPSAAAHHRSSHIMSVAAFLGELEQMLTPLYASAVAVAAVDEKEDEDEDEYDYRSDSDSGSEASAETVVEEDAGPVEAAETCWEMLHNCLDNPQFASMLRDSTSSSATANALAGVLQPERGGGGGGGGGEAAVFFHIERRLLRLTALVEAAVEQASLEELVLQCELGVLAAGGGGPQQQAQGQQLSWPQLSWQQLCIDAFSTEAAATHRAVELAVLAAKKCSNAAEMGMACTMMPVQADRASRVVRPPEWAAHGRMMHTPSLLQGVLDTIKSAGADVAADLGPGGGGLRPGKLRTSSDQWLAHLQRSCDAKAPPMDYLQYLRTTLMLGVHTLEYAAAAGCSSVECSDGQSRSLPAAAAAFAEALQQALYTHAVWRKEGRIPGTIQYMAVNTKLLTALSRSPTATAAKWTGSGSGSGRGSGAPPANRPAGGSPGSSHTRKVQAHAHAHTATVATSLLSDHDHDEFVFHFDNTPESQAVAADAMGAAMFRRLPAAAAAADEVPLLEPDELSDPPTPARLSLLQRTPAPATPSPRGPVHVRQYGHHKQMVAAAPAPAPAALTRRPLTPQRVPVVPGEQLEEARPEGTTGRKRKDENSEEEEEEDEEEAAGWPQRRVQPLPPLPPGGQPSPARKQRGTEHAIDRVQEQTGTQLVAHATEKVADADAAAAAAAATALLQAVQSQADASPEVRAHITPTRSPPRRGIDSTGDATADSDSRSGGVVASDLLLLRSTAVAVGVSSSSATSRDTSPDEGMKRQMLQHNTG